MICFPWKLNVLYFLITDSDVDSGIGQSGYVHVSESPHGKTNNMVSEQDQHNPSCTSTEKS